MKDDLLIMKYKVVLLFCFFIIMQMLNGETLFAQDVKKIQQESEMIKIEGIVQNSSGAPVPSVSISVKGNSTVTITDKAGKFSISVKKGAILVITSVGFINQEIEVGTKTIINMILHKDNQTLEEVVVTGYQDISKDKVTGAYEKISGAAMQQQPTTFILDKLYGRLSGVYFVQGGNGTAGRIEIRGKNTMLAGSLPLYVIDGFPISGSLFTVNPEDIESIYVLKDAAATAQWGVRASNGVIVLTTKKAKSGKMSVDFSSFYTVDESIKFSKQNWMNTAQEIDLDQEYIDKKWFNFQSLLLTKSALNQVQVANIYRQGLSPNGIVWNQNTFQNFISELKTHDAAKQWEDLLFRKGTHFTQNLSISENTAKNSLYASLVYNDELLRSIRSTDKRVVLNIRDEFKISNRFSFNASINASWRKQKANGIFPGLVSTQNAYDDLVDANGNTIQYYTRWDPWTIRAKEALPGFYKYTYNTLDQQRNLDNTFQQIDLRAQFGISYEPVMGLKLESKFQYEKGFSRYDNYNSMDLPTQRILVNDMFLYPNNYQIPVGSNYSYGRSETYSVNWRNTLSYLKKFGHHDISFLTGFDIKKVYAESLTDNVYGYDKKTNAYVAINNRDFQAGAKFNWNGTRQFFTFLTTSNADTREIGFFAMPGYTFRNKYTVNVNFRVDQKNLFGSDPSFRYKPLWSVGAAWLISKEDFMQSFSWINRLNLKGSYGITGNASSNYSPFPQAVNVNTFLGTQLFTYLRLTSPGNPGLKWEETRSLNLSLEFTLLKNRLDGTVSWYRETSVDLLGSRVLDPTSGFSSAIVNYASLTNRGIEISLHSPIIQTKNFTWDVSFNFSYNKNRVTKIDDQKRSANTIATSGDLAIGKPLENIYSYNYAGLSAGGEALLYAADKTIIPWRNHDPTTDELIYQGTSVAPYYGGFQTTFAFKGIDLSLNLSYKAGHYFRHFIPLNYTPLTSRMDKIWATRWQKPGDEVNTRVPKIAYQGINPYTGVSESRFDNYYTDLYYTYGQDWVFKADYIKVHDIILGYMLPPSISKKAFINSLRFTVQVSNPFQWYNNPRHIDPENVVNAAYTTLKTLTLGLRAGF